MPDDRVISPHRDHPVAAAGLLAVAALAGVFAFVHLHLGVPPHLDYPAARVSVRDPGVPASIMDRRIALPLFNQLSRIHGLTDLRSTSTEGETRLTLVFRHALGLNRSLPAFPAVIARALPQPGAGRRPAVARAPALDAVAAQFLVTAPKRPLAELRRWTEDKLMPQFLGLPGVSGARIEGGPVREILVTPDQRRLARLGLAPDDLVSAVRAGEARSPSGYLVAGAHSGSAAIAALPVRLPNGDILSLSQVSAVRSNSRPGLDVRLNGRAAVRLVLMRARSADPIAVSDAIRAHADWLRANGLIPQGVRIRVQSALARSLADMLNRFYVVAAGTLAIVLIAALFPVRSDRTGSLPLLIALVALLASGIFLLIAGMTLNLMDLGGLIVAAGLGLAAPLAMRRSVPARRQHGDHHGTRRALGVVLPMTVMLLVLLVVPGPVGRLFRDLIAVVLAVQCLSWLLVVGVSGAGSGAIVRLPGSRRYHTWIALGTGNPLRALAVAALVLAGLFAGSVFLLRGTVFCPPPESADVQVRISATGVSGARHLEMQSRHIAQIARDQGGVAQVISVANGAPAIGMRLRVTLANHPDAAAAEKWIAGFQRTLTRSGLRDVQVRPTLAAFPGIIRGYRHAPLLQALEGLIAVSVSGPEGSALVRAGKSVARILGSQPKVRDVSISSDVVTSDLALHMYPARAAEHGISEEQVARALRIARGGLVAGTMLEGERRRDIRVALPPGAGRAAELPKLLLRGETRTRQAVYLGHVAAVGRMPAVAEFRRDQGRPEVTVTAMLAVNGFSSGTVDNLEQRLAGFRPPPGYRLSVGGVVAATERASRELSAFVLIALPMLVAALAWLYRGWRRPLIVLSGMPYAVAGSLVALGLGEHVLSAPGWVGLILGTGVGAGLSVMMVDAMDWASLRRGHRSASLAAAPFTASRIVLRSGIGAVAGGMLLSFAGATEFAMLRPLAIALLGGVAAGVAVSILWTPVLYGMLLGGCAS
ncbi:MAG: efflux RND transporter permease subunit [Acidiferrobacterales bacterium]